MNEISFVLKENNLTFFFSFQLLFYRIYSKYIDRHAWINSVEPDQTLGSDQGLH